MKRQSYWFYWRKWWYKLGIRIPAVCPVFRLPIYSTHPSGVLPFWICSEQASKTLKYNNLYFSFISENHSRLNYFEKKNEQFSNQSQRSLIFPKILINRNFDLNFQTSSLNRVKWLLIIMGPSNNPKCPKLLI